MGNDEFRKSELPVSYFEWDEDKRASNIQKHRVDFEDVAQELLETHISRRSDRSDEIRYVAIVSQGRIAVVYTIREQACRIISARRARDHEQRKYREIFR